MAVMANNHNSMDRRVVVLWKGKVSTDRLFELCAAARHGLLNAGKGRLYDEMTERFKQSESSSESMKILKEYVDFQ